MNEATAGLLPDQFSELDMYVAKWANPSMAEQYEARLSSDMDTMQAFHDAVTPLVPQIKAYLDSKAFEDFTEQDRRLGHLLVAWVPVCEAVEVFHQARVPDSKIFWEFVDEPHQF